MRDEENIRNLEKLDIDLMGFIFHAVSPRYAGKKLGYIPSRINNVGVFVDQNHQIIRERAEDNHLEIIQLHGSEPPWYCINLKEEGYKIIKAFGIDKDGFIPNAQLHAYKGKCDYYLFDTKTKQYGGSGKKFNWSKLKDYQGETPFILSGGISPEDVDEIKSFSHPQFAGIDINSRFEVAPGLKDIELIEKFIKQIRQD